MEPNKLPHAQHLRMISSRSRVQPLNDRRHITEDTGVHESYGKGGEGPGGGNREGLRGLVEEEHKDRGGSDSDSDLHPTSITQTVNIFSVSVFGATFPKPTDVNEVKVKYSAVMYRDWNGVVEGVMCNAMARQGYPTQSKPQPVLYLYRGSSGAIDRVMLVGVRSQCIQPANLAVEYRSLCISNGVPGIVGDGGSMVRPRGKRLHARILTKCRPANAR